jgi:Dna[CI] antecedent DciA-like protein
MERAVARRSAAALFGGSKERTLALLRAAWPKAVGPELARRTEVLALEGEALRLRVPDASWRRHLLQMRRPILDRLREVAGPLTPYRLSFTEGGLPPVADMPSPPPTGGTLTSPSSSLAAEAQVIADPDLRERFLEVAARYLANRKESKDA